MRTVIVWSWLMISPGVCRKRRCRVSGVALAYPLPSRARNAAVRAWARTQRTTSRSTLRLTVEDSASGWNARMISARRCSMVRRRAHAQGEELDTAVVEFAEDGLGGDLLVEHEHGRVGAADLFPVVAEGDHLPVLGGFGDVGVGVDEVVGAAVLGEEGEHGAGALGAGGHVVAFQDGVLAPVHDGVEVQVEDRFFGAGQP